jgi:hypothetical protein
MTTATCHARLAGGWCWFVLREKYCCLVAGGWFVPIETYCWLVANKPSEKGGLLSPIVSGESPLRLAAGRLRSGRLLRGRRRGCWEKG